MKNDYEIKYIRYILIILILAITIFPLFWMFLTSFKLQSQITSSEYLFTFKPTLDNYVQVFQEQDFLKYIFNSFIIALFSVIFSLIIGLPAAYGVSRYNMDGMGLVILIVKIVPGILFLIPWFLVFSSLHMTDTYIALTMVHMLIAIPYVVWIMIAYFDSLPNDIEESGLVDGCTNIQVFLKIVLPISVPGIITASLLAFIHSWNHFLFSLVVSGAKTKTLPVAIFNFISYAEVNWGAIMAAACIVILPISIISLFTQRYIVSGLSAGAVKG